MLDINYIHCTSDKTTKVIILIIGIYKDTGSVFVFFTSNLNNLLTMLSRSFKFYFSKKLKIN